jgi:hypothetical protein
LLYEYMKTMKKITQIAEKQTTWSRVGLHIGKGKS